MEIEDNFGNLVEVEMGKEVYEGILLPSPKVGTFLLKLENGYDIGFNKKDVLKLRVLKKVTEGKKESALRPSGDKLDVAMIITGGTIAARLNPQKGGVDWLTSPDMLFRFYPEFFKNVNVKKVEVPFMKASEDMDYKDWQKIAKVTADLLNDPSINGIIITHGTDFLHYTSAALSFFLGNVNKPVVLTYSQRSVDRGSSDANLNLQASALAAISEIAEVMLVGHATTDDDFCYAMPGTKVRKLHTSRRDAFKVVNAEPYARIFSDKIQSLSHYHIRNKNKVEADTKFEEKVALVQVYPGQDPNVLDYYLNEGYKGIVLELSGLGHAPTSRARKGWTKKLAEVQKKGLIVCAAPQTIYGRLDPFVYTNGRELLETGMIYLEDMLPETAYVKLGWVLGHKEWASSKDKIKEKMLENFAGEINKRLIE
jgi:glutamyl-tRNA(Gln) amidotransferase subunit D